MPEKCSAIIDQLIEERHRQGISQRQLAENSQLPQSVIARLESKRVIPKIDTLMKIVTALGCSIVISPNEAIE